MNRKLVFALSLFVLLCSSLYLKSNSLQAKCSNGYAVAPLFTLTDIEGNIVALENLTGKIVVLDFFYPECQYSDDQIVHLEEIYETYSRDELEIISISPKEIPIQDLEEFKTGPNRFSDLEYEISWIIARDIETQNVTAKYNILGYPTTVIIDQDGYILYRHEGLTEESVLSPEIESLLPKTIYVDDDNVTGPWNGTKEHPYQNITSGVEHASDNDTVFVRNGTYYEHVAINKSISLFGENRDTTTIDGNKTGDVIQVRAENVAISGFTIRNGDAFGWHAGWGVYIRDSSGCRVSGNRFIDNKGGICVEYGSSIESVNCTIKGNVVNNNFEGISLYRSNNCIITGNNVSNSRNSGIYLFASSRCTIIGNQIENTQSHGIYLRYLSNNNTVYHNNFIGNGIHASVSDSLSQPRNNTWDNGVEGNYWDNYTGVDLDAGGDGIGDSSHIIDANNQDNYPLMGPISFFDAGTWDEVTYYVHTISNSTVSDSYFSEDDMIIGFNVTGPNDTGGFCRVAIPKELLWCEDVFDWRVRVNGTSFPIRIQEHPDYSYIYFTYSHSIQKVEIFGTGVIPEFTTWTSILLVLTVLTIVMTIGRGKLLKTPIH